VAAAVLVTAGLIIVAGAVAGVQGKAQLSKN